MTDQIQRPHGLWATAYRALSESDSDSVRMAMQAYMNGPDFRADNGLRVTEADYEAAFRGLHWREQKEALSILAQTNPDTAAAITDAIDPFYSGGGAA